MQTVLVVWEHGGNLGHLARVLPIVCELRLRGCAVVVATAHPVETARYFTDSGVSLIQTPPIALQAAVGERFLTPAEITLNCGFSDRAIARRAVMAWLACFSRLKPDAILVDASPIAAFAANFVKIPLMMIGHGFELPPAQPGLNFAPWLAEVPVPKIAAEQRLRSTLDQLTCELSINSAHEKRLDQNQHFKIQPSSQTALCTWPELDHFERTNKDGRFMGPIWSDIPGAHAANWPDKGGPKVLCYLGLNDRRYDLLFQALVQKGANVLVVSPSGDPQVCEATRSWGIVVHQTPIRLADVLENCSAVICNGGMGLVSMALHAGKPLMLVPHQLEQALLCYRLLNRGLAVGTLSLNHKAQVKARVNALLDDGAFLQRVKKLAQRYAPFTPALVVKQVVDRLLRTGGDAAFPVWPLEMVMGLAPQEVAP